MLPPDAHRTINALQRSATVVLQKSLEEGFGLTVTEALWKGKPVIGGACGGITLQVHDYQTGFLVHSPAGAAYRIRYLLRYADKRQRMGQTGHEFVRDAFSADPQSPRLSHDAPLPGSSRLADDRRVIPSSSADCYGLTNRSRSGRGPEFRMSARSETLLRGADAVI